MMYNQINKLTTVLERLRTMTERVNTYAFSSDIEIALDKAEMSIIDSLIQAMKDTIAYSKNPNYTDLVKKELEWWQKAQTE